MSHFTVLVIGDDPEKQLAPYHEFECTGEDDEYVVEVDETEECKAEFESRKTDYASFQGFFEDWHGRSTVPFGEEPDLADRHKYGYALLDESGQVVKVVYRTNPNKKWDWYQLGGRWTGFFKIKPGAAGAVGSQGIMTAPAREGYADSAKKGEIDFDAMRREAEEEAASRFDKIRAIIDPHLPALSWEGVRAKYEGDKPELEGGIDAARDEYNDQPAVKALREAEYYFVTLGDYLGDRADFVRSAGLAVGQTYAIVKDGVWYERGEMGWFGMASNEKSVEDWSEEFGTLIDGLPDETLLSVYDCHI